MTQMSIIPKIEALYEQLNQYSDLLGNDLAQFEYENNMEYPDQIEATINRLQEENRLLKIGIVGRVKAGKSSLLNSLLFNGDDVLPKAATPMTASLTTISYGETISADIEFFTKEDISNIKTDYQSYLSEFSLCKERILKELKDRESQRYSTQAYTQIDLHSLQEKASRRAKREMKPHTRLVASYEQYLQMKESKVSIDQLEETKNVHVETVEELKEFLVEYVSVDGQFMPFTRNVNLRLPIQSLRDLTIVDTPGLNDPVVSREERTRAELKECDVIFVVSPSGQFLNQSDLELMDRITSKHGVHELYVVASQADTQLHGSEKSKNDGDLHKVLGSITSILGNQLSATLASLKSSNPEVGTIFDALIQQGKSRVIHSSGICQSIKMALQHNLEMDDGCKTVWENLKKDYPDYFTENDLNLTSANLDFLSNTTKIEAIIGQVRDRKNEILERRVGEYINAKISSYTEFIKACMTHIENQKRLIESTDLNEAKDLKRKLESTKIKAEDNLNYEYDSQISLLVSRLNKITAKIIKSKKSETIHSINNAEETQSESYTVEKSGVGNWFARILWGGGNETRSRSYTTIRSGAVVDALNQMKDDLEFELQDHFDDEISEFRRLLPGALMRQVRNDVSDDDLEPHLIKNAISFVLSTIEIDEYRYSKIGLRAKGVLRDNEATEFLEEAREYLNHMSATILDTNRKNISGIKNMQSGYKIGTQIFSNYATKISALEDQISKKELYLERYSRLLSIFREAQVEK